MLIQSIFVLRYLVDSKWFKQWKKYVGYDQWDTSSVGEQAAFPGPVDNSPLLKGKAVTETNRSLNKFNFFFNFDCDMTGTFFLWLWNN